MIESEQITGLRHHYPTLLQVDAHKPGAYRVLVAYSTFFVTSAHRQVEDDFRIPTSPTQHVPLWRRAALSSTDRKVWRARGT